MSRFLINLNLEFSVKAAQDVFIIKVHFVMAKVEQYTEEVSVDVVQLLCLYPEQQHLVKAFFNRASELEKLALRYFRIIGLISDNVSY